MHEIGKAQTRQNLRELLLNKGYKPDEVASYTNTDLVNLTKDLYPEMYSQAGNPNIGKAEGIKHEGKKVLGITESAYEVNAWNWSHNWNQSDATFLGLAKYTKELENCNKK